MWQLFFLSSSLLYLCSIIHDGFRKVAHLSERQECCVRAEEVSLKERTEDGRISVRALSTPTFSKISGKQEDVFSACFEYVFLSTSFLQFPSDLNSERL